MVDNPFSSQQAALLPLSKVVALKVASFLGNISEFNEGDTPLPPLMCLQEFYREVKALSALVHPSIVRIEGVVFAPLAIVMEIVNGPSLAQALTDHSAGGWQVTAYHL